MNEDSQKNQRPSAESAPRRESRAKRVLWFVLFLLFLAATVGWFWLGKVWLQSTPPGG